MSDKQLSLLDTGVRPMARATDPGTSHGAADTVRPTLGKIQRLVLRTYIARGPMTARAAERLDEFSSYGFSTIRKRISELAAERWLREVGVDKSGRAPATIYAAAGKALEFDDGTRNDPGTV